MPDKNLHSGHRQRMLKKYLEHGIDCFEDHELLEIFLYTAFSRRNTNDLSHSLINRFGSLEAVMNAGYDELRKVNDVGVTTAALITFLKDFARRFSENEISCIKLDTEKRTGEYCFNLLKGVVKEEVHVLFLDRSMNLISEVHISDGAMDLVEFDMKLIVTKSINLRCSNIILVHNHPMGALVPSNSDVIVTRQIARSLNMLGITLLDHIVVNGEGFYSMRGEGAIPELWI